MPAFSFEKLSPPVNPEPVQVVSVRQHRGIIVQMLDRLTEARMRRTSRDISQDQSQSGGKKR